mgnify:CR=1 FL=1
MARKLSIEGGINMKRKLSAILLTAALLCMCFCGSAFAAQKPSVEVITLQVVRGIQRFIIVITQIKQ